MLKNCIYLNLCISKHCTSRLSLPESGEIKILGEYGKVLKSTLITINIWTDSEECEPRSDCSFYH